MTTKQARRELGAVFTRLVAEQREEALEAGARLGWALALATVKQHLEGKVPFTVIDTLFASHEVKSGPKLDKHSGEMEPPRRTEPCQ